MSKEIGDLITKLNAEIKEAYDKIRNKQLIVTSLQKECEHNWKFDYTCHHKGEDYYICTWCGYRS